MGFTKKTWKNRIAEYINRRLITMEDGSTSLVTVARDEGTISQEGDAFNAVNMNDLEDRIEAGFADVSQSLANKIPDYAHVDTLGTPTTGHVTYNISKDGFFQLHGATLATSASIFYRIRINDTIIEEGWTPNMRYGYYSSPLLPVLKGDVVKVEVDTSVAGVNYVANLYHTR